MTCEKDLRAYFAANCPEEELDLRIPQRIADIRDAMIKRKIIPMDRANKPPMEAYTRADYTRLRALVRWEYADDMLKAREGDR